MLPNIPKETLMAVINDMLSHNRLDVFRPKPGVALFKEFPVGEALKCATNILTSLSAPADSALKLSQQLSRCDSGRRTEQ